MRRLMMVKGGLAMKYLLAVSALLLMASSASAQDGWTKEEQEAGVKRYEFTRRVPAGKPRVLEDAIYLNADCTIIEDIETTITKEPQHGSATIETHQRNPSYPKDSVRAKCNERKVKSQQLIYKPALNFIGDDEFEVEVLGSNGMVSQYTYHVKVVGPSKGGRTDLRP
jgi:hypothetical protein